MIEIRAEIRDQLIAHAQAEFPNEACGLLAGAGSAEGLARAERFVPMTNADASPVSYRLDPGEQFRAFNELDDAGLDLVGIYHSHTHSEAYPSETDRRLAFYPDAHYLLLSLQDREHPVLRGFTIRDGEVEEQDVKVT
ncbi:MAG TPA: M67 family metallopeptidase [Actinomycetota bacterium]|nr:M67 family metallopeptidase [Actinomycetota bacterium]